MHTKDEVAKILGIPASWIEEDISGIAIEDGANPLMSYKITKFDNPVPIVSGLMFDTSSDKKLTPFISFDYFQNNQMVSVKVGDTRPFNYSEKCIKEHIATQFNIDLKLAKSVLLQIHYDDHAVVKVNGNILHPANSKSDLQIIEEKVKINNEEFTNYYVEIEGRKAPCDEYVSKFPSIDLMPHLHDGMNSIEMDVAYKGSGKGYLLINQHMNYAHVPHDEL